MGNVRYNIPSSLSFGVFGACCDWFGLDVLMKLWSIIFNAQAYIPGIVAVKALSTIRGISAVSGMCASPSK